MTKKELTELYYISREIEMWRVELERIRAAQTDLKSPSPNGMPRNGEGKDPIGEKVVRIVEAEKELQQLIGELEEKKRRAQRYIVTIDDSLIRQIITYRCLSLMTWEEVAAKVGGSNSADSVRKQFDRFFERE